MRSEIVEHLAGIEDEQYGCALLHLLVLAGWDVAITSPFDRDGVLVSVRKLGGIEVRREGESVTDVAVDVFVAAKRAEHSDGVRLRLVE